MDPAIVSSGSLHKPFSTVIRRLSQSNDPSPKPVVDCEPVIGYLHRGMEKIAENRTNVMFVPYVSRMDYAAGMFYEAIVVNAPERLANIKVPKRGKGRRFGLK